MKPTPLTPDTVAAVRGALLAHYDEAARDLPWRRDSDPYRIWVSEVMLQQTRVETVLGYYEAWLRRFPDLDSLARASEDEVLKAWEGLGYYRRARNLHRGAQVVRDAHGGEVPQGYQALRELPGVGEYTAGAVASIAFGEAVPAVDGNVRRVLARLFDLPDPKPAWLRDTAGGLVDPQRPGDWNQALMELGATVCVPRSPRCVDCPLSQWCGARQAGTQGERPAPPRKKAVPRAHFVTAVVVDSRRRCFLRRRPDGGLLGGMWAFPEAEIDDGVDADRSGGMDRGGAQVAEAARDLARGLGLVVEGDSRMLPAVRHRFTHLDATYHPVLLVGQGSAADGAGWFAPSELDAVALPVAQQKIASSAAEAWTASQEG